MCGGWLGSMFLLLNLPPPRQEIISPPLKLFKSSSSLQTREHSTFSVYYGKVKAKAKSVDCGEEEEEEEELPTFCIKYFLHKQDAN